MATVGSAIVCDRLRLYGNRSLCDRLRSTIRDRLRSAIVCDRLRSYGNQPLNMSITANYGCFSLDVIASMLVRRPIKKKLLWQFDSIIMQNVSHDLRLFCAPTWPSYDVIGEHLLINKSAMLHTINHRQGIRGISGGRFFSSDICIFDQISNYCPISEMSKERFN